ncbi:MAG: tyrosine-type recombinase/integrase, partial [Alphaproteobacteria bacterium]
MADWPTGIRPDGAGLRIRIWSKGRSYSETIQGELTSALLTAAVKRRDYIKARMKLGLPIESEPDFTPFEVAAQEYLDTLDAKRSTHLTYENILNRYWMPAFAGVSVTEISQKEIKRLLAKLDVSNKTRRNIIGPLAGVLSHAGINPNPAAGIRYRRRQKPVVSRYSPQERDALLGRLSGQPRVYFSLLFSTGLRPGEALGLLWSDWDGQELIISKQITRRRVEPSTKTSVRRRVYVPRLG